MTEVRTKKVTFDDSLPRGTCATFTHEGARWIAYPQDKVTALAVVLDKALGVIDSVRDDLVRWINVHPTDAPRVMEIMARTNQVKKLAEEKVQAWTM